LENPLTATFLVGSNTPISAEIPPEIHHSENCADAPIVILPPQFDLPPCLIGRLVPGFKSITIIIIIITIFYALKRKAVPSKNIHK